MRRQGLPAFLVGAATETLQSHLSCFSSHSIDLLKIAQNLKYIYITKCVVVDL